MNYMIFPGKLKQRLSIPGKYDVMGNDFAFFDFCFSRGKKLILSFLVLAGFFFVRGQETENKNIEDKYQAINWRVDKGLVHDEIYCILKDVHGFLWIGTEGGLSRFDGSTFKNYYYDPKKPGSIGGEQVWGMVEDSLHNIWIGTDNGLSRYDINADTLRNFFPDITNPTLASFIVPFAATKEEVYCQETDSAITSYNVHSLKKKIVVRLRASDSVQTSPSAKQNFIFDSNSNSIWILRDWGHGILQIFPSTGERVLYNYPGGEVMLHDPKRNSLWLNTDEGLIELTLGSKQFRHIPALKELETRKSTNHIGLDLDSYGRVWFHTHPEGIYIYDPKDESVQKVFERDSALQQKIAIANRYIYCDRDGMVWTGSWLREGLWQLTPFSQVFRKYNKDLSASKGLHTNNILNFTKGKRGEMWLGTGAGLALYDIYKDEFKFLQERDLPGFKGKHFAPIYVNTVYKKAWLINENWDIYEMDINSRKCTPVIFRDSAGQLVLPKLLDEIPVHYKNGCIIAATLDSRQCVFIVNGDSAVAKQILSFPAGTINFSIMIPTTVTDHLLFLRRPDAMGNFTYSELAGKWIRTKSPMDTIPWDIITYDKADSSYWVVVTRQLMHFDHSFRLIRQYGSDNGLPNDKIYGLIPDTKGNIWFNTYRSIYELNVETGQTIILSEKDGFQPSDFRNMGEGIGKDDNGDLYFTTGGIYDGFRKISPGKIASRQSLIYIKSLEIREFSLPLAFGANIIQELKLKYFQNRIIVETGTIDFYSQGKSRIRYKLEGEGRNESWQYAPANYTIRYEELPPGKYELMMQAGNAGNEFTGPVKSLLIHIRPAFWNTWWFRVAAILFIAGVFYAIIRTRLQQKFRLQLERSEKETQLAEIRQKASEMEMQALRAQMNPHFIFNSLNSINRFILQNNRLQASEYLTKFSKLVRLILQNSQASLISLESELESMQLYLDLEAVRFNHRFQYKISVPKDLDIEVVKVPPLIIQPFAENSIWHGLMHRPERPEGQEVKGQLDIEVSQVNDQLQFRIADNGIGRKAAAALASKSATKHKSVGLKITAERIAMLQKSNGTESPVTINDLVHVDGSAAGTEVIIRMPVMYE